jgi:transcriptional regulator with XRE-family HTH domain
MTAELDQHLPSLAGRLLTARYAAGITQEELSSMSGVSVRTISGLETGRVVSPRQATIRSLALALRIDLAETRSLNLLARSGGHEGSSRS